MNVIRKINNFINTQEFLAYLIALVLSTLLLGYAISSMAVGVFVFFSIRYAIIHKNKIVFELALIIPLLLYVLYGLTLFWSVNQSDTKNGLERTVTLFLIPIAFSIIPKFSLKNYKRIFEYFTKANILLGLFFFIIAIIRYFKTFTLNVFLYHDLVKVLDLNAIYVSVIFSMSLFYLLSKASKTKTDRIGILFFSIILVLLSSKTLIFALLIGVLVYVFNKGINIFNNRKLLLAAIVTILIIGISSVSVAERILFEKDTKFNEVLAKENFGKIYPWTGSSIRVLQLRILKEQIEEEAIFWKGFGLFASRKSLEKRHLELDTYKGFHNYNYHNQYAQILSETGIFGLVLLLIILIINYKKALKTKNFLILMFGITTSLIFFTESFLWRQRGLFLFITLYSLFIRVNYNRSTTIDS